MKKFKLFIASVLTYFMAMSILPTSLLQTVVNAAENEYTTLVKSDYYLRSNQQYGNRSLIAYYSEKENKVIISKVEGGKETVLKEVDGYQTASISKYNDNTAIIEYINYSGENGPIFYYEKYTLNSNTFEKVKEDQWKEPEFDFDFDYDVEDPVLDDSEIKTYIDIVNKAHNLNISIENMRREMAIGDPIITYRDEVNEVIIRIAEVHHNPEVVKYEFTVGNMNEGYKAFKGIISGDYVYLSEKGDEIGFQYDKYNNTIFITDKLEYDYENGIGKYRITEVKDNKVITDGVIETEDSYYEYSDKFFKQNNKLFIYTGSTLTSYTLSDGIYNTKDSITLYASSKSYNKYDNAYWYIGEKNNLAYLGRVKDGEVSTIINFSEGINPYSYTDIFVYDQNNIILEQYNSFIIIQNNGTGTPINPGKPEQPQEPENNDNVVVTPSNGKVVAEVSKINPNEKNEIAINTNSEAKNVEVVLKDIEALKSGKGSLNISVNNSMKMNLPLSLIDSELLQGASDVTIKLDILENSDILKDKNAVNKVFDFNLIINREDGQVNVHNFKDGLAEVEILLSDKDLEGLNKDKLVVYYYNDADKTFEAMETSVEGNKVTFKTSHFSKYVIAEKVEGNNGAGSPSVDTSTESNDTSSNNSETGKGNLPETGARVSSTTIFVVALGIMAIGGAMFFRKRRHA